MEKYRAKLNDQLNGLAMYMHRQDVEIVRQNIVSAKCGGELDSISLGLGFHQFRVEQAKEKGSDNE